MVVNSQKEDAQRELLQLRVENERLRARIGELAVAGASLAGELTLDALLQKIVDSSRALIGAKYAALGVFGADGRIQQFIYSGISAQLAHRIGDLPQGRGLLGLIAEEKRPIRVADMASHPRAFGFPPHHPTMKSLLGVPIVRRGVVHGNLYLADKLGADEFAQEDEELLILLAGHAAVAIENARLHAESERRASEWRSLYDLGRQVASSLDTSVVLETVVRRAHSLLNTDIGMIALLAPDRRELAVAAAVGLKSEATRNLRFLADRGLAGVVLMAGEPVFVEDYNSDPRLLGGPLPEATLEGLISVLAVPFAARGRPLGVLYVASRRPRKFTTRDSELLEACANLAAIATDNARLLADARQRERESTALYDIGKAISSLDELDQVTELIAQSAGSLLATDVAGLALTEPAGSSYEIRWKVLVGAESEAYRNIRLKPNECLAGQVIAAGRPLVIEDIWTRNERDGNYPIAVLENLRSVLLVPLGRGRQPSGVLMVAYRRPHRFTAADLALLERLADQAAIAVTNIRLFAQSELERSRLEAIFNSMTESVCTSDLNGRMTRLNQVLCDLVGVQPEEVVGQQRRAIFTFLDETGRPLEAEESPLQQCLSTGEPKMMVGVQLLTPQGGMIPMQIAAAPIRDLSGVVVGAVEVFHDLRPQREIERLKANIISSVSHELKTPLAHIKGFASTLLQLDVEWDLATQREFIESIDRQADRLNRLINDLLEMSRLDASGAAGIRKTAVATKTLVERGIKLAGPYLNSHLIELQISDAELLVSADLAYVERVLANLVENAAKYSEPDTTITIGVEASDSEVKIWVKDQGVGISESERPHLFERFYRSERVRHRAPGTGLGLAICKGIVEAHSGRIWVESVEGAGATFSFTLPRVEDR